MHLRTVNSLFSQCGRSTVCSTEMSFTCQNIVISWLFFFCWLLWRISGCAQKTCFFSAALSLQAKSILTTRGWMFPMFCCECERRLIETRWHALDLTPERRVSSNSPLIWLIRVWPVTSASESQSGLRNMCLDWPNDILHVINLVLDAVYRYREPGGEFDTTFTRLGVAAFL